MRRIVRAVVAAAALLGAVGCQTHRLNEPVRDRFIHVEYGDSWVIALKRTPGCEWRAVCDDRYVERRLRDVGDTTEVTLFVYRHYVGPSEVRLENRRLSNGRVERQVKLVLHRKMIGLQ